MTLIWPLTKKSKNVYFWNESCADPCFPSEMREKAREMDKEK
jgi:hypothetical protein